MGIISIFPEDDWEIPMHEISQPKDIDYTAVIEYTFTFEDVEKENLSKQYRKQLTNLVKETQNHFLKA